MKSRLSTILFFCIILVVLILFITGVDHLLMTSPEITLSAILILGLVYFSFDFLRFLKKKKNTRNND